MVAELASRRLCSLVGGQLVEGDVEALEYGPERPGREIARVSGDDRRTVATRVVPDLMAPFALPL